MNVYQKIVDNVAVRRWMVLFLLIAFFYSIRAVLSMVLLTFIFTFLVVRLVRLIQKKFAIKPYWIVIPTYLLVLVLIYMASMKYIPIVVHESLRLIDRLTQFVQSPDFNSNIYTHYFNQWLNQLNVMEQVKNGAFQLLDYAKNIAHGLTIFCFSFLLSFFYTLELDEINRFGRSFFKSTYSWFFEDIAYFAKKFNTTFGYVVEAQLFVAITNTIVTTLTLIVMKMPFVTSLAIMIFILSLIPVAGAFISAFPLGLIAFSVGGIQYTIYIILLIIVIHALEAYIINPRFMANRTELPMFMVFVVLLAGEHFWGIWGLLLGVPTFTFFLDILDVRKIESTM